MSLLSDAPDAPTSPAPFVPTASHARKRKEGHIPRPPNAFMIFRSKMWRDRKLTPGVERDHRNVSCIAGLCWKDLTPEQQKPYRVLADLAKQRHIQENPGYKYAPVSRKQKQAKRRVRNDDLDRERCKKVASLMGKGFQGSALEDAVNNGVEGLRLSPSPAANTTTATSSSAPRARARAPKVWRVQQNTSPLEVKVESPVTPALYAEPQPEFVPTAEIPPLDLSATAGATQVRSPLSQIHTECVLKFLFFLQELGVYTFDPALQPPKLSPSYSGTSLQTNLDTFPFTNFVSMGQNAPDPNFFPSTNMSYPQDPFFSPWYNPTSRVDYGNMFTHQLEVNDTALALLEHKQLYPDSTSSVTATDPFYHPFSNGAFANDLCEGGVINKSWGL
jgi:hypothetical protein